MVILSLISPVSRQLTQCVWCGHFPSTFSRSWSSGGRNSLCLVVMRELAPDCDLLNLTLSAGIHMVTC